MTGRRDGATDEVVSGIHKTGQSVWLSANGEQGKGPILSSVQAETIVAVTETTTPTCRVSKAGGDSTSLFTRRVGVGWTTRAGHVEGLVDSGCSASVQTIWRSWFELVSHPELARLTLTRSVSEGVGLHGLAHAVG